MPFIAFKVTTQRHMRARASFWQSYGELPNRKTRAQSCARLILRLLDYTKCVLKRKHSNRKFVSSFHTLIYAKLIICNFQMNQTYSLENPIHNSHCITISLVSSFIKQVEIFGKTFCHICSYLIV